MHVKRLSNLMHAGNNIRDRCMKLPPLSPVPTARLLTFDLSRVACEARPLSSEHSALAFSTLSSPATPLYVPVTMRVSLATAVFKYIKSFEVEEVPVAKVPPNKKYIVEEGTL